MLLIYEEMLQNNWENALPGSDVRSSIRRAIGNLLGKGQHYGPESKAEKFDFIEVRVSCGFADRARVLVHERWFLPLYDSAGVEIRNRNVYIEKTNEYYLRKITGRWLLEKTSTPYAKPSPTSSSVSANK